MRGLKGIGLALVAALFVPFAWAQTGDWSEEIAALAHKDGFVDLYLDAEGGRVLVALPKPDEDGVSLRAIQATGLTAGLGSNPIGLDRGRANGGEIVAFRKVGDKIVAEIENWAYRASADNPLERKAVRDSFARSFVWSGEILGTGPEGELLVDLSTYLTRDTMDVRATLKQHPKGGAFQVSKDLSMPDVSAALAFPDNVEFDAFLTLTSDEPKAEVWATAADARSVTLVQHTSLVRLPDDGYTPRMFDPRSGAIDVGYYDFSAPLTGQVGQSFARRFRLQKQDPTAESSPAKEPIVFYVDSGAPQEIRDALIEGASWWADAFEAAGFPDSFRVEVLPEGAHPLDVRYNVIQWVHRQTRGWSYGGGLTDPRTGEMLKANVILGSQRVRQDRMIFEGLAGAEKTGMGEANDPVQIALSRIRQLSAHEVGHTLGFAHNFAASSNDRASVMDYPAPFVRVGQGGDLDFSAAYDVGIGEWDKVTTMWLYRQYTEGVDESAAGDALLESARASGLRYIDDPQGRGVGTAHPYASVWDNGADPVASLLNVMQVRDVALENFGLNVLQSGEPTSRLRAVIVPIYLYHRYQVNAAAKMIGGYEFHYAETGEADAAGAPVPASQQRAALDALVATLDPAVLDLPNDTLDLLTPPLVSFRGAGAGAEYFPGETGAMFDLLTAADTSASQTLSALFHPQRVARLIETQRRDAEALGYGEVLAKVEATLFVGAETPRQAGILHREQIRYVSTLIELSASSAATPAAVAQTNAYLSSLKDRLSKRQRRMAASDTAVRAELGRRIAAHLDRPSPAALPSSSAVDIPPGSPIGAGSAESCWHCDTLLGPLQ
ncbi:zinc-dependent metalloprotease [Hyphomonas atlantica corrig.]|uniref:zinc-dependent metalloprotease n=1 Tax=Hyphomonas atlantica TaxID=1280948 RepID=UPI002356F201|nr:zinc-dependent metalloprotease [Hyphomonas atlantica]